MSSLSIGDVLSVSILVKELLIALNDSRGSAAEYRSIISELLFLDKALLHVDKLFRGIGPSAELEALHETAQVTVQRCQESMKGFRKQIDKYDQCLGTGGSGNGVFGAMRKVQWMTCSKGKEVARFRAELTGYTDSLQLLLTTVQMKSLDISTSECRSQSNANSKQTQLCLSVCEMGLQEIQQRLAQNNRQISNGNSLGRRLFDRTQWISNMCCSLKQLMCSVINGNCAVYQEVLCLKRLLLARPLSLPCEEPFVFEDACGTLLSIPLSVVNSWDVFQAVLEQKFQGLPGLSKIRRREYALLEEGTGRQICTTLDMRQSILPGTKVVQEMLFHQDAKADVNEAAGLCPYCGFVSEDGNCRESVRCQKCKKYFRREQRLGTEEKDNKADEKSAEPSGEPSLKRKRSFDGTRRCSIPDPDLYKHFRRICIVVRCKAVQLPSDSTFSEARKSFGPELDEANDDFESELSSCSGDTDFEARLALGLDLEYDSHTMLQQPWNEPGIPQHARTDPAAELDDAQETDIGPSLLTCNRIWEKLQACPKVQTGDFDLDGLCSDLQKKAKCSGSGAVVDEGDFTLVMQKHLGRY